MKAFIPALLLVLVCSVAASTDLIRINQALIEFKKAFLDRPPFNQHLLNVQMTTLEDEKKFHNDIELTHDETWQSWCLDVTVGMSMPQNIKDLLPSRFWEFKVFYNKAGSSDESSQASDGVMCTMMAYICPDGTTADRTPTCGFVCGAQPIGGLSYDQVDFVRGEFEGDFIDARDVSIETLYGRDVELTPTESTSDYCLVVALDSDDSARYPDVYNGVRVFYYTYVCTDRVCEDGSVVSCDEFCAEDQGSSSAILVPLAAIIFVVTLSTCCCYLRRRTSRVARLPSVAPQQNHEMYPAEQMELLRYQEEQQLQEAIMLSQMPPMPMMPMQMSPMMMPLSPEMAAQMGLPPMPPVPPMSMNGNYPVMVQGPNGMWFPVYDEEAQN